MIRIEFYDKENRFVREVEVIPRIGETVVLHTEKKTFRYRVVDVGHVYEDQEWYQQKDRDGDPSMGDKTVVELTPM